jgi:hypothetical protein
VWCSKATIGDNGSGLSEAEPCFFAAFGPMGVRCTTPRSESAVDSVDILGCTLSAPDTSLSRIAILPDH